MRFLKFWRLFVLSIFFSVLQRSTSFGEVDFNNTQVDPQIFKNALSIENLQNRNSVWYAPNAETSYSGFVKKIYPNTQVDTLIRFSSGVIDQVSKWQENGIPIYSVECIPGSMSPFSIPNSMEDLDSGIFHGLARFWYPGGYSMLEAEFTYGKRNGITRTWYENGNLKVVENYKNGLKDGNAHSWYESGEKWMKYTHWNDKRDGPLIWWYENGKKRQEGNYKGGIRFGEWSYFRDDGTILYRKTFRDGKEISTKYGDNSKQQ